MLFPSLLLLFTAPDDHGSVRPVPSCPQLTDTLKKRYYRHSRPAQRSGCASSRTTMTLLSIALRNLARKPIRTILLAAIIAATTAVLFSSFLFARSISQALRTGASRLGADILVVPEGAADRARSAFLTGEPTHFLLSRDVLGQARTVAGVEQATPQLFIKPRAVSCCGRSDVFLIAFDPATDMTVLPWLSRHVGRPLGTAEIVTGSGIPAFPGDVIPFFGTVFTVAAVMEPTGMDILDRSVFMTMDAAHRMAANSRALSPEPLDLPRERASAVLVRVAPGASPDRVAITLEHEIPGVRTLTTAAVVTAVKQQTAGVVSILIGAAAVLVIVALLVQGLAVSLSVSERRRELGLLRAMGATRRQAGRLILTEALLLAAFSGTAGVILGLLISRLLAALPLQGLKLPHLALPFPYLVLAAAASLSILFVSTLVAAALPVRSIGAADPYDAIRSDA